MMEYYNNGLPQNQQGGQNVAQYSNQQQKPPMAPQYKAGTVDQSAWNQPGSWSWGNSGGNQATDPYQLPQGQKPMLSTSNQGPYQMPGGQGQISMSPGMTAQQAGLVNLQPGGVFISGPGVNRQGGHLSPDGRRWIQDPTGTGPAGPRPQQPGMLGENRPNLTGQRPGQRPLQPRPPQQFPTMQPGGGQMQNGPYKIKKPNQGQFLNTVW